MEKENNNFVSKEEIKDKEKDIAIAKKEAIVNAKNIKISTKHSVALCNFIRNKKIDEAIAYLEKVVKMKIAVPMKGEIPHRKGIMSGRYPINASKEFIRILRSLRSNAIYYGLELEKLRIFCIANMASRPYKRFGQRRSKRSHVQIKLMPVRK